MRLFSFCKFLGYVIIRHIRFNDIKYSLLILLYIDIKSQTKDVFCEVDFEYLELLLDKFAGKEMFSELK